MRPNATAHCQDKWLDWSGVIWVCTISMIDDALAIGADINIIGPYKVGDACTKVRDTAVGVPTAIVRSPSIRGIFLSVGYMGTVVASGRRSDVCKS